jgi:acyl-CoA reductase-like NAD-dependent aldehyde dehydrogenase
MGGEPVSRPEPVVSDAKSYIAGKWRDGEEKEALRTPIDGTLATLVWSSSVVDAGEAVEAADDAWRTWRAVPAFERARVLHRLADFVQARQDDLSTQMVIETGKLWREARAEVSQSVDILHICAEEAKRIFGEGVPMDAVAGGAGRLGFTLRVPLGVIVGITPFNVPISAACHKLGPALAAGNTDADMSRAVSQTVVAAFALTGQSCASTQRIFVHKDASGEFTQRFVEAARAVKAGDPFDEASGIGPLVSEEAARRVADWVSEAVAAGARLLCGGERRGAYLGPTVLAEPTGGSRVLCEEVFGPVVSITAYSRFEDAVAMANGTPWGLKAGVFTSSLAVALMAVNELQFGSVNVNAPSRFRLVHEPYGSVKQSGWGREGPRQAVRAMTAERMVSFAPVDWPEA